MVRTREAKFIVGRFGNNSRVQLATRLMDRAGLAWLDTGRFPDGPMSVRAAIEVVFKFTINYYAYIKYFGQERKCPLNLSYLLLPYILF